MNPIKWTDRDERRATSIPGIHSSGASTSATGSDRASETSKAVLPNQDFRYEPGFQAQSRSQRRYESRSRSDYDQRRAYQDYRIPRSLREDDQASRYGQSRDYSASSSRMSGDHSRRRSVTYEDHPVVAPWERPERTHAQTDSLSWRLQAVPGSGRLPENIAAGLRERVRRHELEVPDNRPGPRINQYMVDAAAVMNEQDGFIRPRGADAVDAITDSIEGVEFLRYFQEHDGLFSACPDVAIQRNAVRSSYFHYMGRNDHLEEDPHARRSGIAACVIAHAYVFCENHNLIRQVRGDREPLPIPPTEVLGAAYLRLMPFRNRKNAQVILWRITQMENIIRECEQTLGYSPVWETAGFNWEVRYAYPHIPPQVFFYDRDNTIRWPVIKAMGELRRATYAQLYDHNVHLPAPQKAGLRGKLTNVMSFPDSKGSGV